MKRSLSASLMLFPVLLWGISLAAQEVTLTEREAVERALGNSAELKALETEVQLQERKVAAAGMAALQNPELRMQDISTKYVDNSANREFQLGLRWQPPKIGALDAAAGKEQVTLWEKKVRADKMRRDIVARTRQTYAECAMSGRYEELARERGRLARERVAAVERLVELGQRPLLDKIKARKRQLEAAKDAAVAVRKNRDARERLALLTGVKGTVAAEPAEPPVLTTDRARLREMALAARPEAELARQESAWYESRSREERMAMVPWFSFVQLGYHYESDKPDSGELLFGVEIPLFNWIAGNRFSVQPPAQYGAERREAAAAAVERELADAAAVYEQALGEWRAVTAETESAIASFGKLLAEAKEQALPADEVLDIELTNIELSLVVLEARCDLDKAAAELSRATGIGDLARLAAGPEEAHE